MRNLSLNSRTTPRGEGVQAREPTELGSRRAPGERVEDVRVGLDVQDEGAEIRGGEELDQRASLRRIWQGCLVSCRVLRIEAGARGETWAYFSQSGRFPSLI